MKPFNFIRVTLIAVAVIFVGLFGYFLGGEIRTPPAPISIPTVVSVDPGVCLPGATVAPIRVTEFVADNDPSARPYIAADVGDALTVKSRSGDKCYVTVCVRGQCMNGRVRIADLGTPEAAKAIIAGWAMNRSTDTSLAAFPQTLRDDLARRATSGHVGPVQYDEKDLEALLALVQLCSEVKEGQYPPPRYAICNRSTMVGVKPSQPVEKPKRNLAVRFSLKNDRGPYRVTVFFTPDQEDANLRKTPRSVNQLVVDYFDLYGVGNYRFSR